MILSERQLNIVSSGLTSIECYVFEKILSERYSDCMSYACTSVADAPIDADYYILGISAFLKHIQYYMPRRSRLSILVDSANDDIGNEDLELSILRKTDDIELIKSCLFNAIEAIQVDDRECCDLTPREKEVLCLIAKGETIKEIALQLNISVNTALTHRKNISSKLGIRSVSGLSLYAMINGLI